tara:strand:- start:210 stop:422 length:213 start_codon:yes stop_codon:yes gene_type:complete
MEPTVNITDVVPGAIVVTRQYVVPGMTVFDTMGGEYLVQKVRHYKEHSTVWRDDGVKFFLYGNEDMTVRR